MNDCKPFCSIETIASPVDYLKRPRAESIPLTILGITFWLLFSLCIPFLKTLIPGQFEKNSLKS